MVITPLSMIKLFENTTPSFITFHKLRTILSRFLFETRRFTQPYHREKNQLPTYFVSKKLIQKDTEKKDQSYQTTRYKHTSSYTTVH